MKFITMNTHMLIVILNAPSCLCFAAYDQFPGFKQSVDDISDTTTDGFLKSAFEPLTTQGRLKLRKNAPNIQHQVTTVRTRSTIVSTTESQLNQTDEIEKISTETQLRISKLNCSEEEVPSNIGPYEVPSQKDMLVFTRNILLDLFNGYNRDAFYLLKDIRQATKATASLEGKCKGSKREYKKCVKSVSDHFQLITKNMVMSFENQKHELSDLMEGRKCNLSEMKNNPIRMINLLSQERVSLEFALPGFLRLLNACFSYCIKSESSYKNKPVRHMTDQDLVIKHFLTRKNYLELIMDSRHKIMANSN